MKQIKGILFFTLIAFSASTFAYTITTDKDNFVQGTCDKGDTFIGTYSPELQTASICHNKRGCFNGTSKFDAIRKACDE